MTISALASGGSATGVVLVAPSHLLPRRWRRRRRPAGSNDDQAAVRVAAPSVAAGRQPSEVPEAEPLGRAARWSRQGSYGTGASRRRSTHILNTCVATA